MEGGNVLPNPGAPPEARGPGGMLNPRGAPRTSAFQARSVSSRIDRLISLCWFFSFPNSSSHASLRSKWRRQLNEGACWEPPGNRPQAAQRCGTPGGPLSAFDLTEWRFQSSVIAAEPPEQVQK